MAPIVSRPRPACQADPQSERADSIRESGKDLDWFERDPIRANHRGEQVVGHILTGHPAPPVNGGPGEMTTKTPETIADVPMREESSR
jgi:hypothetical protein